jgi:hypothetical protein
MRKALDKTTKPPTREQTSIPLAETAGVKEFLIGGCTEKCDAEDFINAFIAWNTGKLTMITCNQVKPVGCKTTEFVIRFKPTGVA